MGIERTRRFSHPYREHVYIGADFAIELREGVRYRVDYTDLSRLRSLESNLLELGYTEVSQ